MKILATSDIHGSLPDIPDCDLLLIGGDILSGGIHSQYKKHADYVNWVNNLTRRGITVVATPGNHDFLYQSYLFNKRDYPINLLIDEGLTYNGLKIWGMPWQPIFYNWAFNADEERIAAKCSIIPEDTDILLLHGPPYGCLDANIEGQHVGSPAILEAVLRIQPKVCIFGHIHESFGESIIGKTKCYNVSYYSRDFKETRKIVEIKL